MLSQVNIVKKLKMDYLISLTKYMLMICKIIFYSSTTSTPYLIL